MENLASEKIILTYVGKDTWSRPTFKVGDTETYVKDISIAHDKDNLFLLWSCPRGDVDGEPDYPFEPNKDIEIVGYEPISRKDELNYQMLSRLKSDCDYYLGHGDYYAKGLYYQDVKEQIQAMRNLYDGFSDNMKPQWITIQDIDNYEKEMMEL